MQLVKNTILDVGVTNAKQSDILEYVVGSMKKKGEKYAIVTPNPEILVYATKHHQYQTILNQARIALCDGMGLFVAGKIMGKPFIERISGVDFMENLCRAVAASNAARAKKTVSIGFLGGRKDVAERTANCLVKKYPGLKVNFAFSELPDTKYEIPNTDILFVAFGFPKQEEWIVKHLAELPITLAMGVGGAFDYISGNVSRAPLWVQSIGFEWLYRLFRQPWRIKRQLALIEFVFLIVKERLANTKS